VENIDLNIGQFHHEFIFRSQGKCGAGATSNRFFPSLGNHDWALGARGTNAIQPFLDYFTLPGNERYHSVKRGLVDSHRTDR
jgi:tartrate-resistant acid phosphatase type 5